MPKKENLDPDGLIGKFYQIFTEKDQLLQNVRGNIKFFYEDSIALILS